MSREADLTYVPKSKDLKDVVCFSASKEVLIKIINHYLNEKDDEPTKDE